MGQGGRRHLPVELLQPAAGAGAPYTTIIDGLDLKAVGGDPHGSGFIRYATGGTIRAGESARDPGAGSLKEGNLPLLPSVDQVFIQSSPSWATSRCREGPAAGHRHPRPQRDPLQVHELQRGAAAGAHAAGDRALQDLRRIVSTVAPGSSDPSGSRTSSASWPRTRACSTS
jgi:hypothetical protein